MQDLIIVGASGLGREVLQWTKDINKVNPAWNILGFIDDNTDALDGIECDYGIIGTIRDWQPKENEHFVMAIAKPEWKAKISQFLEAKGAQFVPIIHPTAIISDYTKIGKGIVVYPYAKINVNSIVGDFVTLLGSTIGHDATVGDYTTICGTCNINGHAVIGNNVFIGSHAVVAPGKRVGDSSYVGNGSVVISNIKAGYTVFGNPAKRIQL